MKSGASARFLWLNSFLCPNRNREGDFCDGIRAADLRLPAMKSGASARFLWLNSFLCPNRNRGGDFCDGIRAADLRLPAFLYLCERENAALGRAPSRRRL